MSTKNNETWLPCPFCGFELFIAGHAIVLDTIIEIREHERNTNCVLGKGFTVDSRVKWNKRTKKKGSVLNAKKGK